ncbi:RDD family protein [Acidovorax sp. M2(2025)]|uniref:RDD family protein n=1 Tax=Acidovorax sp. M2(2025) TaxID=3411355 RepID=UPI003BF5D076
MTARPPTPARPGTPAAPATAASPLVPAPQLWRRMACWLYEGMLLFGVVFIAGYLFGTLSQTRNAMDNRHALQAFLFVVFGIYFTWFWAKGQTLAQKTWHIRVVAPSGRPISQARALLRYVLSWVWFLPPLAAYLFGVPALEVLVLLGGWVAIWAILSRFHPEGQFWHDALAGTRLVHHELPPKK